MLIAMELARGGSRARPPGGPRTAPGRRPWPALLGQLLDALVAVHAHGLVHGDVKPANLLLERRRPPRSDLLLADFGAATSSAPRPPGRVRHPCLPATGAARRCAAAPQPGRLRRRARRPPGAGGASPAAHPVRLDDPRRARASADRGGRPAPASGAHRAVLRSWVPTTRSSASASRLGRPRCGRVDDEVLVDVGDVQGVALERQLAEARVRPPSWCGCASCRRRCRPTARGTPRTRGAAPRAAWPARGRPGSGPPPSAGWPRSARRWRPAPRGCRRPLLRGGSVGSGRKRSRGWLRRSGRSADQSPCSAEDIAFQASTSPLALITSAGRSLEPVDEPEHARAGRAGRSAPSAAAPHRPGGRRGRARRCRAAAPGTVRSSTCSDGCGPRRLLEPDDVVDADPGQHRQLLAAQPRHPAVQPGRQPDVLGPDPVAGALDRAGQLGAVRPHPSSMARPPARGG